MGLARNSLTDGDMTFPYFVQLDRSMADQFFRPGFTQRTWVDGESWKGLHYELFVGNGLNTLTTNKIDHLVYSGSVWCLSLLQQRPAVGVLDDDANHQRIAENHVAGERPVGVGMRGSR